MTTLATTRTQRPVKSRKGGVRKSLRYVLALIVGACFVAPYAVLLFDALRPNKEVLTSPPTFLPSVWDISAFRDVLADGRFRGWLWNSLIISVASTAVVIVIAIITGYITSRYRFRGKGLFILLLLLTQMLSPTMLIVGLYREFYDLGLVNSLWSLVITNAAFNLAFAVLIVDRSFSAIPREIDEAAQLDGASRLKTIGRILVPLAAPGIVTATIFSFIMAWNEYVLALTLVYSDEKKPLTVGINAYVTGYEQNWTLFFAASLIAVVPVVVLFMAIERHLAAGLTAGAVK